MAIKIKVFKMIVIIFTHVLSIHNAIIKTYNKCTLIFMNLQFF